MNKKAAIEFSANVIVIIIISTVILALGLMLFFNLKGQAEKYTDTVEQQTQEQLQALMLNDNSRVAIYPNDLTIQPGKSQMTTVAVNNMYNEPYFFKTVGVALYKVDWFQTPTSAPISLNPSYPRPPPLSVIPWWRNSDAFIVSSTLNYLQFNSINPGEQSFRNILIKMPKTAKSGQYVVTINITTSITDVGANWQTYGLTKLYITVP